jgi:hypothetical protein
MPSSAARTGSTEKSKLQLQHDLHRANHCSRVSIRCSRAVKFIRIGSWVEESDDKRYTVGAARVRRRFVFDAWRRADHPDAAPVLPGSRAMV